MHESFYMHPGALTPLTQGKRAMHPGALTPLTQGKWAMHPGALTPLTQGKRAMHHENHFNLLIFACGVLLLDRKSVV